MLATVDTPWSSNARERTHLSVRIFSSIFHHNFIKRWYPRAKLNGIHMQSRVDTLHDVLPRWSPHVIGKTTLAGNVRMTGQEVPMSGKMRYRLEINYSMDSPSYHAVVAGQ